MADTKVNWREWGDAAFDEARAQDKPILLGISAVWCHWCHVMDRGVPGDAVHTGVYNNLQLADFINANFVPVRVDNDQRPDINARYNMGGWPTTSFLTPDGDVIYGGTYFSPGQMRQLLPQIAQYWQKNRAELLQRLAQRDEAAPSAERPAASSDLPDDIIANVLTSIAQNYEPKHGGLGTSQKFPMPDVWALLTRVDDDVALRGPSGRLTPSEMVKQTLVAMGTRGTYDAVAGGWFRYSTTPDWSVPHFEKMLEDHARLLAVYLDAFARTGEPTLARVARASLDFLCETLLREGDDATYFAGSQDADEEYYLLSKSERAEVKAPFIDWRLYADWNALMVPPLLQAASIFDEPRFATLAGKIVATLIRLCLNDDGSVTHSIVFSTGGAPTTSKLRGVLNDQATLATALLTMAQTAAEPRELIANARRALDFAARALAAPGGGFFDRPADPAALGMLKVRIKTMADNAGMADALMLLHFVADDAGAKATAIETLAAFAGEYARFREHAAPYALAVFRATTLPTEIVIVGDEDAVAPFAREAVKAFAAWRVVRVLQPARDAALIAARGYPTSKLPAAFVCRGTTCSAPIFSPRDIAASL